MSDFSDVVFEEGGNDQRCAVVVVLDCSDSMTQTLPGETQSPMQELNAALDVLVSEIHRDKLARRRAEFSFIPYGTEVSEPTPFATVGSGHLVVPELSGMGLTYTAKALTKALDHLDERKNFYKSNGVLYNRPIVLLISDGLAMDDLSEVSERIKQDESKKRLSFFSVGITGADLEQLSSIGSRPALKVADGNLGALFQWLSTSVASVSNSSPDDKVKLPSVDSWAEL